MKATVTINSDEPVLVLVLPLRKAAPRPAPDSRRVIDTTAEPAPSNVVQLRRTA